MATQVTESRQMEILIETLAKTLSEAQDISSNFQNKARTLLDYDSGQDKKCASDEVRAVGHLPRLGELIEGLQEVNYKNDETLKHLNSLL